jgi:opacity protein-like surface antigen
MMRLLLAMVFSLVSVSSEASAVGSGFYFGAGVANGSMTATCQSFYCSSYRETAQDSGHGRLIFGYDFNRFIGIEGGYSDYGTYNIRNGYQQIVGKVKMQGVSLAARGGYKFSNGLSVFGKLGLASMNAKYSADPGWVINVDSNQQSTGLLAGIGVQYDINNNFTVRLISEAASFSDSLYHGAVGGLNFIGIVRF